VCYAVACLPGLLPGLMKGLPWAYLPASKVLQILRSKVAMHYFCRHGNRPLRCSGSCKENTKGQEPHRLGYQLANSQISTMTTGTADIAPV